MSEHSGPEEPAWRITWEDHEDGGTTFREDGQPDVVVTGVGARARPPLERTATAAPAGHEPVAHLALDADEVLSVIAGLRHLADYIEKAYGTGPVVGGDAASLQRVYRLLASLEPVEDSLVAQGYRESDNEYS